MPIKLTTTLKREIVIDDEPYTVTIGAHGVKVTAKGFRKGRALRWRDVLALGAEEGPDGAASGETASGDTASGTR